MFKKIKNNIRERRINDSRLILAVNACYLMGKTEKEAAEMVHIDANEVSMYYEMIKRDMIDWENTSLE